ncbi:hypothetical protein N9760_04030 [Schleiferiaceae bacterium]|nr:hypothetical protein [Schleiferiaceae bacterium]
MNRFTRSEDSNNVLNRVALLKRLEIIEMSLDMASNMRKDSLVIDRFQVVRLVMDTMQHVRIDHCWKEIDKENELFNRPEVIELYTSLWF